MPIIGAMFMFRLVIYLYDLRNERGSVSIWQRLGYFFLLPNICFPLFPVVDYQTFRRTYYDRPRARDLPEGRPVDGARRHSYPALPRHLPALSLPAPQDVSGLGGVVQYMVATYGLYLRISGQFHLVVGILCLFGFNLPETHHLYFLATGFTDYWRRINIYWKDFMAKVFFFPAMMRFKRLGMRPAMVLSTGVVFFATWVLHSYQWYWLRGTFPDPSHRRRLLGHPRRLRRRRARCARPVPPAGSARQRESLERLARVDPLDPRGGDVRAALRAVVSLEQPHGRRVAVRWSPKRDGARHPRGRPSRGGWRRSSWPG